MDSWDSWTTNRHCVNSEWLTVWQGTVGPQTDNKLIIFPSSVQGSRGHRDDTDTRTQGGGGDRELWSDSYEYRDRMRHGIGANMGSRGNGDVSQSLGPLIRPHPFYLGLYSNSGNSLVTSLWCDVTSEVPGVKSDSQAQIVDSEWGAEPGPSASHHHKPRAMINRLD